jgi:hypothetical protein
MSLEISDNLETPSAPKFCIFGPDQVAWTRFVGTRVLDDMRL